MNLIRIIENEYKNIIKEENNNIKLYHRIGNKKGLEVPSLIKRIIEKGLIRNDNREIGNVIWFSSDYNDYAKNGQFVVSIDYNDVNKQKYEIYYDGNNGYVYKDIPFEELEVIKIPTIEIRNNILSSDTVIDFINKGNTVEKFNKITNMVIYEDIFNMYVQPYIEYKNFMNDIDRSKIKVINIL